MICDKCGAWMVGTMVDYYCVGSITYWLCPHLNCRNTACEHV